MNSGPEVRFQQVSEQDEVYPKALRELADRPKVLYIQGRWPLPEKGLIGIVGTRRATAYGLKAAAQFTVDLVRQGCVTVSGLAAGIDACVHRETLKAGGWTVAVLGHGFGFQYPRENAALFEEIAKKGTLVTEFSYDVSPQASYFPQRNRIISGLSQATLVIEAGYRSGALITARNAAEQGRDVFVVPGSIFSSQSVGCHRLIKEGAQLVESAAEMLEDVTIPAARVPDRDDRGLSQTEKDLLKHLSAVPVSVDELSELSGLSVDRLAEALLSLEIKGKVHAVPGQRYVTYG